MPARTFHASARSPTTRPQAWQALQRAETWAGIAGVDEVTDVTRGPDGALAGFDLAAVVGGRRYPGTAVVADSQPPSSIRVEVVTSELAATIDVDLDEDGSGTRVGVVLTVTSRSFLGGLIFPVVADALGTGLDGSVRDFAARLAR